MYPRLLLALILLCAPIPAAEILVDDFESIDAWSPNQDGGVQAEVSLDTETVRSGEGALRVRYDDAPPQWSNLRRSVTVPADATAVSLWVHKHSAATRAAMHLWLMEADNDAWVAPLTVERQIIADLDLGWHHIVVPIGDFGFDARGPNTRDMTSVDRMLLGFNFADMEVTVDDLEFVLREGGEADTMPPLTEGLAISEGERGNVVILRDELPVTHGAADPEALGQTLQAAGWGVTYTKAGDLLEPSILADEASDVLIIPGGPAFPVDAVEPLKAFLKRGGGLVAIGGYAFDEPLTYAEGRWGTAGTGLTAEEASRGDAAPTTQINTRSGTPGDTMRFDPDQLQVFDPQFLLRRVSRVAAAPGQGIIAPDVAADVAVEGYAAVSTLGSNSPVFPAIWGRRVPLLEAYDGYGRLRGSVGALIHNFAGPYAGSSWAIFGATNVDLFTGEDRLLLDGLPRIVEAVARPTYIARLSTDACYRQGEDVTVRGEVVCGRGAVEDSEVVIRVGELAEMRMTGILSNAGPGELVPFAGQLRLPTFDEDLYTVTATLAIDGELADTCETGFVVWDERVLADGPEPGIEGSYITINGRPTFMSGTNQTGFMWFSEHENPLVWDRDFRTMADNGVNVLRILHFSPFCEGGYEGRPTNSALDLDKRPEKLQRQTDAIVQLAQKHGIILFLSLHDWIGVGLSDEEYAAQADWDRFWCERYADVPGVIYDIQNEPNIGDPPDIANLTRLYNLVLQERYAGPEELLAAWGIEELPGEWGDLPIQRPSNDWDDASAHDYWRFKMAVYNKWVQENVNGIRNGDFGALITVGNLNSNVNADKQVGSQHLDFTNTHFYGSLEAFSQIFKFLDRRWEGKPSSVGEFGAQAAHDARTHGADGARDEESIRRFLWFGHYVYGLGGSFLANWSWKDFEGAVFPWGLRYVGDDVSKDVLLAFRAQSLLLRRLEPEYQRPEVYLVQPDSHRFGPDFVAMENAMQNAFVVLYHAGVPFGVLGEWDLERLPEEARALIWPVPYCPSDETFERIEAFVRGGGSLYVSGDIAFDEFRRPTRAERLERLGLPDIAHVAPRDFPETGLDAGPVVSGVGDGRVFFVPCPLELRAPERALDAYRAFFAEAGIESTTPSDPPGQVLRVPLRGGGYSDVLAHYSNTGDPARVSAPEFSMMLSPLDCGLVAVDADGGLTAFHAPSDLRQRGGREWLSGDVHLLATSLTDDGLEEADAALLAPITPGETVVNVLDGVATASLEIGDVVGGKWVARDTQEVTRQADGFHLDVSEDAALSLMLLVAPRARDAAVAELEDDVALRW